MAFKETRLQEQRVCCLCFSGSRCPTPAAAWPPTPTCRYGEHEALRQAKADGMHWLLHLDPDELLHPGKEAGGWVRGAAI